MSDAKLPPIDPPTPEPTPEPASRPRRRIWVRVVLFVSLALNLLIIGVFVGAVARHSGPWDGRAAPRLRDAGLGPLTGVLSRTERGGLRAGLAQRAPELRENRSRMRRDLMSVLKALRAERFDAGALAAAMENQRNTISERQAIGQAAFLDQITHASPAKRREMADRIEKALKRGRNHDPKRP